MARSFFSRSTCLRIGVRYVVSWNDMGGWVSKRKLFLLLNPSKQTHLLGLGLLLGGQVAVLERQVHGLSRANLADRGSLKDKERKNQQRVKKKTHALDAEPAGVVLRLRQALERLLHAGELLHDEVLGLEACAR